jgi:hypothetical protein
VTILTTDDIKRWLQRLLIVGYFAITLHSPNSKWEYVVSRSETIGLVTNMDSMHTIMLVAIGDSSNKLRDEA